MCTRSKAARICCFCGLSKDNELEFGKFYEYKGVVTHYYCLLLSSNMEQKGKDDEGILGFLVDDIQKEIRRGKRLVCSYCKQKGATLGCCNTKCKKIFHFPCGLGAGSLHQFFGEFRSYCIAHRPKQKIDDHVKREIHQLKEVMCYICYDKADPHDSINTLWAPCCKKNAWFHRMCIQQLAMSAGYFFKCPLCNNKKEFQQAMLEYGIFIPSQDASWELVPNAFQELLYRHDQCDALECMCPKGRKHTSSNAKWELALCRTCGSQGIHMACGQLKWAHPVWDCDDCSSIICKSKESTTNKRVRTTEINKQDISRHNIYWSESDDSDTEISVGSNSPVPSASTEQTLEPTPEIKIRPGPRSFKLQQQAVTKIGTTGNYNLEKNNDTEDNNMQQQEHSPLKKLSDSLLLGRDVFNTSDSDVIMIDSDDDIEIISHKIPEKARSLNISKKFERQTVSCDVENLAEEKGICPVIRSRIFSTSSGNIHEDSWTRDTGKRSESYTVSDHSSGRATSTESVAFTSCSSKTNVNSAFSQVTSNLHRSRLIPEHMNLRDFKFRMCGPDSLQMILYNTFSVNINMDTAVKRNSDAIKTSQNTTECISKMQLETIPTLLHDDMDHDMEYKCTLIDSDNDTSNGNTPCRGSTVLNRTLGNNDTKENLNPSITNPYERLLSTSNATGMRDKINKLLSKCDENSHKGFIINRIDPDMTTHELDVHYNKTAVNNTDFNLHKRDDSKERTSIPYTLNTVQGTGQTKNVECSKIKDTYYKNDDTCTPSVNKTVPHTFQDGASLNRYKNSRSQLDIKNYTLCVMANSSDEYSMQKETLRTDFDKSEKLLQRNILHRQTVNSNRSRCRDMMETCKVSIDLQKIQALIDSKPHLFSKYKPCTSNHCYNTDDNSDQISNRNSDILKSSLLKDQLIQFAEYCNGKMDSFAKMNNNQHEAICECFNDSLWNAETPLHYRGCTNKYFKKQNIQ